MPPNEARPDLAETEAAMMSPDFDLVRGTTDSDGPARPAFDYLTAHALAASFVLIPRIGRVRSVELQWPSRRLNAFSAQAHRGHINFYLRSPVLTTHAGLFEAAVSRFGPVRPNSLQEYRTKLRDIDQVEAMLAFLREHGAWPAKRHSERFVTSTLSPVGAEHLLAAARSLADGAPAHPFGPSTDFDVIFEGLRLPPKAVFGLAATAALGFPVRPANFRGGEDTPCFRALRAHGYRIVRKGAEQLESDSAAEEDRVWTEGDVRLVAHLRRERGTGLASAKREAFRAEHGRLFCERCRMDPVVVFGSVAGEACIEVHHRAAPVSQMDPGHRTRLEDLDCLCANCHRVTHRELKEAIASGPDGAAAMGGP
jgi:hypothetical protein